MNQQAAAHGAQPTSAHGHHGGDDHEHVGHVVSVQILFGVLMTLLVLTWLTYWTSTYDLGFLNIWVAMGIASVKASLVVLFFMHLFWDRPFNRVVFVATLIFLGLFISFSLLDARAYHGSLDRGESPHAREGIQQYEAGAAAGAEGH